MRFSKFIKGVIWIFTFLKISRNIFNIFCSYLRVQFPILKKWVKTSKFKKINNNDIKHPNFYHFYFSLLVSFEFTSYNFLFLNSFQHVINGEKVKQYHYLVLQVFIFYFFFTKSCLLTKKKKLFLIFQP